MTRSGGSFRSYLTAAAAGLCLYSGCRGEEDTCDYWSAQLGKQKKEKQAIEKVAELKCEAAVPALEKLWADTLYQRELLTTVKALGPNEGTIAIVKKAIEDQDFGPIALQMAVDWKVPGLEAILSGLIQNPKSIELRREALKDLLAVGAADLKTDTLIWVVGQDPTQQGIETNQLAANELGKVDWNTVAPEKAKAAAENLVRSLFMKDAKGDTVQINARIALRKVGQAAVEPLLRAYSGDDDELNEFAESRGVPRWRFTHGHELVELLWDLGDPKAARPLAASIGMSLDTPPDVARLDEPQQDEWIRANQNRLATTAMVVGALGSDDAVGPALEILGRKGIPLDPGQFMNAGLALGLVGSQPAREGLWTLFRQGDDALIPKRARIAELKPLVEAEKDAAKRNTLATEHDRLIDEVEQAEREKARWITNLSVSLSGAEAEVFQKEILDLPKGPVHDAGKAALPTGYFAIVSACKDDAACYVKALVDQKGKLASIPKAIKDAGLAKDKAKADLVAETKPITAQITAKEDELGKKSEYLDTMRKDFDESKKSPAKLKELGMKTLKEFADKYNAELEAFTLGKDELKKLYESRNAVIDKLTVYDQGLVDAQAALYKLEKASLVLGRMLAVSGEASANTAIHTEAVAAITALFAEAKTLEVEDGAFFQQFKQWSLIALDRLANKDDSTALEALRQSEAGPNNGMNYATIRLDAILVRLKR